MKWFSKALNVSGACRLMFMMALGWSSGVLANTSCSTENTGLFSSNFPAIASVGRDLPTYSPLAVPRVERGRIAVNCLRMTNTIETKLFLETDLIPIASAQIGLVMHAIYATSAPNIGLAVASRFIGGEWVEGYAANVWEQAVPNAAGRVNFVKQYEVSYTWVTTAPVMSGRHYVNSMEIGRSAYEFVGLSKGSILHSVLSTNGVVDVFALACNASDVTVDMGDQRTADFGNSASMRDVRINLHNCPPGLSSVTYRISGSVRSYSDGFLNLDSGAGTARGVVLQLLKADGVTPLTLGWMGPHKFEGYDPVVGGDAEVRLKARYQRDGSPVSAGAANVSATFTMQYQ